jgi:DNA-binding NarL/FixJ family response regulator
MIMNQTPASHRPIIVVLDDEEVTRSVYPLLLNHWSKDLTVLEFGNSADAWTELSKTRPDLLIMRQPISGQKMLPLLAANKVNFPILVASSFFNEAQIREAAGPDLKISYLPLPFGMEQFRKAVSEHVHLSDSEPPPNPAKGHLCH